MYYVEWHPLGCFCLYNILCMSWECCSLTKWAYVCLVLVVLMELTYSHTTTLCQWKAARWTVLHTCNCSLPPTWLQFVNYTTQLGCQSEGKKLTNLYVGSNLSAYIALWYCGLYFFWKSYIYVIYMYVIHMYIWFWQHQ